MGYLDNIQTALKLKKKPEKSKYIFTSERSEWSSYQQLCMGRLDDIQTALKLKKKIERNVYD